MHIWSAWVANQLMQMLPLHLSVRVCTCGEHWLTVALWRIIKQAKHSKLFCFLQWSLRGNIFYMFWIWAVKAILNQRLNWLYLRTIEMSLLCKQVWLISQVVETLTVNITAHSDTQLVPNPTVCTWCCLTMGCLTSQWWNSTSSVWANIDLVESGSWLRGAVGQR